ncbi:MAG: DnaJ domain-containing protein [Magnetococcales bacterium]|nr:DnaJ domain-containing protein [Magnetococcales bacterium]
MTLSIPWRTTSTEGAPAVRMDESPLPPGMRRVQTRCKACGKALGIRYPEAVIRWKVQCPACAQGITIELVGGRKCLVFQVKGRKIVERIGLTDQRRRFYRARCFSCDETLVVPENEVDRLRGCHGCGLEYRVREDGEFYYETSVRINDELTTYRDKVQESSGYIANKNTAFFVGEDALTGSRGGRNGAGLELQAAMAALRLENERLREREEAMRAEFCQLAVDRESVGRNLAREQERLALLEQSARELEAFEKRVLGLQGEVVGLTRERDQLRGRMQVHGEALRALDEALSGRQQLEARLTRMEESLRRSEERNDRLGREREALRGALQVSESQVLQVQDALRRSQEERDALEARLLAVREAMARLEERVARADRGENGSGARLRELEEENARLQSRLEADERRFRQALERETLRGVALGGEVAELEESESWYCEEGEEGSHWSDSEVGRARRLLGLKGQPTAARIKTAFRRRVKRYHPDMVSSLGVELRDLAHRKMQEINRAYGILMKEYGNG